MATANAVSAAQTGASAVSVTVNGLGERAGNAPLEEVVMALFRITGVHTRVQTTGLSALCRQVETFSGIRLSDAKPVTGKNVFRHESGIHCAGMLKNTDTYQLFRPETIGKNGFECVIGYHSGTAAVCHAFETYGITITPEKARSLLPVIRQIAMNQKSHLTPLQLQQIYAADRLDAG